MIGIPIAIFYYIYLAFVLGFLLFTAFHVFHLLRFGFLTFGSMMITAVYLLGSLAILVVSWSFVAPIDWTVLIPLSLRPTIPF